MSEESTRSETLLAADTLNSALPMWDIKVTDMQVIKVRENAVFRMTLDDGTKLAARVHRPGYHSNEALASEFSWLLDLQASGVHTVRPLLSKNGNPFECVYCAKTGTTRQVDLLHWIEGESLGSVEDGVGDTATAVRAAYLKIGQTAALVHAHGQTWVRPKHFKRPRWDLEGLLGANPHWGRFWELDKLNEAQRSKLLKLREYLTDELSRIGESAEDFGLIHADLVPENILVSGSCSSVIDFDDCGHGWYLFDLATPLLLEIGGRWEATAREALIDGYRRHRELTDQSLAMLPTFVALRATTYLGWLHTRAGSTVAESMAPFVIDLVFKALDKFEQSDLKVITK